MKADLSIIMPLFNSEKTIISTLKSLENQSNKSFELIIVDDGSTDNSIQLIESYISKNRGFPIRVITQINGGQSKARNTGIINSNHKYIMFIDSDDCYEENMVQTMLSSINEIDIQLVTCGILKKIRRKNYILNMESNTIKGPGNIAKFVNEMQEGEVFNYVWNKIYSLDIIKKHGILFNNNLSMGEDFQFNLNYIEKISQMKILSDVLYIYNTDESYITNKIRLNDFENRKENIELLDKYYKKNDVNKDLSFQYIKIFYSDLFNTFRMNGYLGINNNIKRIKELLKKTNIVNLKVVYKPETKINNILFLPIKNDRIKSIYFMTIIASIGKKINIRSLKSRSM